ncbi:MAG: hypothetical protein DRP41_06235 [Thermodesulfobacteriota bacterium]|nr:MAG: hypothetical protein DRP41_06235 [Thermodesulfobacteriota bacterium]
MFECKFTAVKRPMASSFLSNCDFTLLKSHFTGPFTDDKLLYDYQVLIFELFYGIGELLPEVK